MRRYSDWRRERGSWVLCEEIRAHACELDALVDARRGASDVSGADLRLLDAARESLERARRTIGSEAGRGAPSAARVTTAQVHLDTARSLWLRSLSITDLEFHMPGMLAAVREHLPAADERRLAIERVAAEMATAREAGGPLDLRPSHREAIVGAVGTARQASLREKLRADSFVRIVRWVAASLALLAIAIEVLTMFFPDAVPLCFHPADTTERAQPSYSVVCPTQESTQVFSRRDVGAQTENVVSRTDYAVVEIAGLVAAAIAATSALRKVRGTSTAFGIPVALGILKLPTGALTAVAGLLLMRGDFLPGLSALDSSGQIIAWAVIFGYSQELFTSFVDRRGQHVLEGIRGPATPATPAAPAAPAAGT